MQTETQDKYLSCPETAKLIRKALKRRFPGVKFSVRSRQYSMGASIDVRWTDGPLESEVDDVAGAFAGATFDGMTDLMHYHKDTHLAINGDGQMVEYRVRYGADFVFCRREITDEDDLRRVAESEIRRMCDCDGDRFGNDWIENLALNAVHKRRDGESVTDAVRAVVINRERR